MTAANYGGYDNSFVDKNLEKFTCTSVCTKVLRNPHLTKCCGQHFCESCLNYWFTKHRKESCPHCRAEGEEFLHFLDKKLKREIDILRIHCTNKEEGCQWVGELGSLKNHLESANGCGYVEVGCPNECKRVNLSLFDIATVTMTRKDLDDHLKNKCYLRPYQCEHCGHKGTCEAITGCGPFNPDCHYNLCPEFPLECPNECGLKNIKRKHMDDHCNQCPEEEVECPYKCQKPNSSRRWYQFWRWGENKKEPIQSRNTPVNRQILKVKRKNLATHYFTCPEFPLECPNECGANDIKRKDMEDHRSQCPREPVQCPFEEAGCKQMPARRELEQHLATTQQQHLLMVMGAYKEVKQANEEMEQAHTETKKELDKVKAEQTKDKELEQYLATTLQQHLLMVMGAYKEMKQANEEMEQAHTETKKELDNVKAEQTKDKEQIAELKTILDRLGKK